MMGSIVWTTIVLVGMISQTISGDGQAQSTSVGITADQLVEQLANLPTEFPDASDSISEEINGLLMSIVDPTKTIFQSEFTAEKLLKLKEWNMGDCTEDKLRERKALCQQFTPKSHAISKLKSLIEKCGKSRDDEEQHIGASLGLYCLHHFDRIKTQCWEHLYEEAIIQLDGNKEDKEMLKNYRSVIIDYWLNHFVDRDEYDVDHDGSSKSKVIKKSLRLFDFETRLRIGRICSNLVEKLWLPFSDDKFSRSGGGERRIWRNYYNYCLIALKELDKDHSKLAVHSQPTI